MRNLCGSCKHKFKCRYVKLGIKIVKCENYKKCDETLDRWLIEGDGGCLSRQKKRLKNSILDVIELH